MSVLDRLDRLVRSNVNDLLSGDDSTDRHALLDEMEASLRQGKRRRSDLEQVERELADAIRTARDRADNWEERALLALQNDDEALARKALEIKNEAAREASRLRDRLETHRSQMETLQTSIRALEMKLESHAARGDGTGSRTDRARRLEAKFDERRPASDRSNRPADRSGSDVRNESDRSVEETFDAADTFDEFDRMAGEIDARSAEVDARRELADEQPEETPRARLESRFRELERADRPDSSEDGEADRSDPGERREGEQSSGERGTDDDRRSDRLSELKERFGRDD